MPVLGLRIRHSRIKGLGMRRIAQQRCDLEVAGNQVTLAAVLLLIWFESGSPAQKQPPSSVNFYPITMQILCLESAKRGLYDGTKGAVNGIFFGRSNNCSSLGMSKTQFILYLPHFSSVLLQTTPTAKV